MGRIEPRFQARSGVVDADVCDESTIMHTTMYMYHKRMRCIRKCQNMCDALCKLGKAPINCS
jgi:hypothetical protein